jgi:hypothetical protein
VLEADQERLKRHEEILAALGYEPVGFTEPAEAAAACRWELRNNLGAPTRFDAVLLCSHLHGAGAALEPGLGSSRQEDLPPGSIAMPRRELTFLATLSRTFRSPRYPVYASEPSAASAARASWAQSGGENLTVSNFVGSRYVAGAELRI